MLVVGCMDVTEITLLVVVQLITATFCNRLAQVIHILHITTGLIRGRAGLISFSNMTGTHLAQGLGGLGACLPRKILPYFEAF